MGKTHIDYVIENLAKRIILEELQEIRQEILSHREVCVDGTPVLASKIDIAVDIIDKHIKEFTNEECN